MPPPGASEGAISRGLTVPPRPLRTGTGGVSHRFVHLQTSNHSSHRLLSVHSISLAVPAFVSGEMPISLRRGWIDGFARSAEIARPPRGTDIIPRTCPVYEQRGHEVNWSDHPALPIL